jgi:hypothetical protein
VKPSNPSHRRTRARLASQSISEPVPPDRAPSSHVVPKAPVPFLSQKTLNPAEPRRVVEREVPLERVVLRDRPVPAEAVRAPALCPYALRRGAREGSHRRRDAGIRMVTADSRRCRDEETLGRCARAQALRRVKAGTSHGPVAPVQKSWALALRSQVIQTAGRNADTPAVKARSPASARTHDGRMHARARKYANIEMGTLARANNGHISARLPLLATKHVHAFISHAPGAHQDTSTPNTAM